MMELHDLIRHPASDRPEPQPRYTKEERQRRRPFDIELRREPGSPELQPRRVEHPVARLVKLLGGER